MEIKFVIRNLHNNLLFERVDYDNLIDYVKEKSSKYQFLDTQSIGDVNNYKVLIFDSDAFAEKFLYENRHKPFLKGELVKTERYVTYP